MEKQHVKNVLEQAAESVVDLPKHLQEKAFELAVGLLAGKDSTTPTPTPPKTPPHERRPHDHGGDHRSVSELLKHCKRNPDRYIVFLQDLEHRNEGATLEALDGMFGTYKQDKPGNMVRDLANLVANDLTAKTSKEYGAPWILKRKGRDRHAEIVAAASAGKK